MTTWFNTNESLPEEYDLLLVWIDGTPYTASYACETWYVYNCNENSVFDGWQLKFWAKITDPEKS